MSIESLKKALSANQTLDDALLEAPAAVPADTPLSDPISWSPSAVRGAGGVRRT